MPSENTPCAAALVEVARLRLLVEAIRAVGDEALSVIRADAPMSTTCVSSVASPSCTLFSEPSTFGEFVVASRAVVQSDERSACA